MFEANCAVRALNGHGYTAKRFKRSRTKIQFNAGKTIAHSNVMGLPGSFFLHIIRKLLAVRVCVFPDQNFTPL